MMKFYGGLLLGLMLGWATAAGFSQAQCCGVLDLPISTQVDLEYQNILPSHGQRSGYPTVSTDLWKDSFTPCAK